MKTYKLPQLIIPSKNAKDKRIYVQFYIYSSLERKLVRKRVFALDGTNDKERIDYARIYLIPEISKQLIDGAIAAPKVSTEDKNLGGITIIQAIKSAIGIRNYTVGLAARQRFEYVFLKFLKYLEVNDLVNFKLHSFSKNMANDYQLYLIMSGLSNVTTKNNITTLKCLINVIMENDNSPITKNPFIGLKKLSLGMGRNLAYSPAQIQLILGYLKEHNPGIFLLANTMYYTLMRTIELSDLQRKHINMVRDGFIYIAPEINTKHATERHVRITGPLNKLFIDFGVYDLPPEHYIFSRHIKPGPRKYLSGYLGSSYTIAIKKIEEFSDNRDYTLYSWKHTGVVAAYKAGIKPYNIMKQTGHKSRSSFEVYLKSLGLEDNSEFADNMPELIY